ncbi:MAG: sigma-54-dependent Fis family transcriptional regulator [Deltaproteobacteria bacterium]|nr:sigma-54-dependent Fis family transcriptional regulator [Deltaproteobacteria bacterium]
MELCTVLDAKLFRIMFENMGEGVVFADSNDQICFVNTAAELIRGIRADDYLGRNLLHTHPPRAAERISVMLNKFKAGQLSSSVRTIHIRNQYFENSYYPIRDESGVYVGTLMVSRDVTEKKQLKEQNRQLLQKLEGDELMGGMIGKSAQMKKIFATIAATAQLGSTVLITGESGTGKELVAAALHAQSSRQDRPFVKINCAALPESLIEAELFGHVKGAFTGADRGRAGKFEQADHGTIFLDEIGDMPLAAQVKLLRVLQERIVERVGGSKEIRVDVRIVAATNRNLRHEIEAGRFREDLYYRLHVIPIHIAPLRERGDDIIPLAERFMGYFAAQMDKQLRRISADAQQALLAYAYPGNIRELENIMERSVALCGGDVLTLGDLPSELASAIELTTNTAVELPSNLTLAEKLAVLERSLIEDALTATGGRKGVAAVELGISRKTLWDKMSKW